MRTVFVMVTDVLTHEALQMPLVEDDYMVEQIPSAATDPALRKTILPGEGPNGGDNLFAKVSSSIEDQVARSRSKGDASRSC